MVELHPALIKFMYLLGQWSGNGVGGFPATEDYPFAQELSFTHTGGPFLIYASRIMAPEGDEVLQVESGFLRPRPDGSVEMVIAQGAGVVEVLLGTAEPTRFELASDLVARTPSAAPVAAEKRLYGLVEGALMYAIDRGDGRGLRPHLSATLTKRAD